jgi:hypothetical protein
MATQPIDYAALAKQAGAISSTVDYAALAKQAGAISSTAAPSTDAISNQPKFLSPAGLKSAFYKAVDATANALPGGGATVGGMAGAASAGPLGAIGGAGIGGMAGAAAKHLLRRAAGFEESNNPNAVAQDITKEGAIQGAIQGATDGLSAAAGPLKAAAVGQYERALAPTTKINKAIAEKISPQMVNRGLHGNLDALAAQAKSEASVVKPQLDAAYQAVPNAATQGSGWTVLSDLQNLKGKYIVDGKVANPTAVDAINKVQDVVQQYGPDISPDSLRKLKGIFDDPVAAKGGFAGADLTTQYSVKAQKAAANSIRTILNGASPDVAALNKEISFWLDVQRVTGQSALRRTGQEGGLIATFRPYLTAAGAGMGMTHGPEGGLVGATAAFMAAHAASAMRTPAWRTASAVVKDQFANALARGDVGQVLALSARFGVAAPGMIQTSETQGRQ